MDAILGRKVLDHVEAHRDLLDMSTWGHHSECGTVACLAGWTLVISGEYRLAEGGAFVSGDGVRVPAHAAEDIAAALLRLDDAEWHAPFTSCAPDLFDPQPEEQAIARFRVLVEAAEAQAATAGGGTGPRGASMNHGASFSNGPGAPRWSVPGLRPVTIWDFMEWRPYE